MAWYIYGIGGTLLFSLMILLFRWLFEQGLSTPLVLMIVFGVNFIVLSGYHLLSRAALPTRPSLVIGLTAAAVCSGGANYLYFRAVALAPNPGYATALNSGQVVLVSLAAFFLFGSELTLEKLCGIALCLSGVYLVSK